MKVIQADATNARGLRNVIDGEAELLKGFEFNINGQVKTTIYAPYTTILDRVTGDLTINIPSFVPVKMIAAPQGATHYNLVAGGSAIDFGSENYMASTIENGISVLDNIGTPPISLVVNVGAASTFPLVLILGIQFYQEVNGLPYQLNNDSFNALAIVDVSGI